MLNSAAPLQTMMRKDLQKLDQEIHDKLQPITNDDDDEQIESNDYKQSND